MAKRERFTVDDVVITEDGRVIITNKAFAARLLERAKVKPGDAGIFDNCDCGKGAVELLDSVRKLGPGTVGIFDNCDCKGAAPFALRKLAAVRLSEVSKQTTLAPDTPVGIFDNCDC